MSDFDNRSEERKKVCVHAFAFDASDTFNIKCIIRDISTSGCLIITSQLHELPDFIQLVPEGFGSPLNGKIVWRNDKRAGVSFLSPASEGNISFLNDYYSKTTSESDEGEPLLLGEIMHPMSYAERLANYVPPRK